MFNIFKKFRGISSGKQSDKIIAQVRDNYNIIAKQFSDTRYIMWPEFKHFEKYIKDGQNILDWGCGNGRYLRMLKKYKLRYFGVDISSGLVQEAKKLFVSEIESGKAHFACLDDGKLKFPTSFFDVTLMIASFHHLPDEKTRLKLLKDIFKEMKPKGKLIITVWNLRSVWAKEKLKTPGWSVKGKNEFYVPWKNQNGEILTTRYYHSFSKVELKDLVEKSGFKVLKLEFVKSNNWSDEKGGRNLILIAEKK